MNVYCKKRKIRLIVFRLLLFCCFLISPHLLVQSQTVSGTVVDTNNEPIAGASVAVKYTTNGTMTDTNGKYTISATNEKATLVFSFIGFATQEVVVGTKKVINVTMASDDKILDEVVVTALGMTRDSKALGYAMTELKGDDLVKSNIVNPVNALQGKVAGVQINMGSSGPQSSQRILIRGNTSMSGNNQPIFVIDGIIVDNEVTKTGDNFDRDFGNDLKNLNSDDFETVSVLKGAAATALYGSRASNGVILITTKKGKKNQGLGINFSHTQQWESVYSFPKLQNEFGMGTYPLWPLNDDGTENRNIEVNRNFGPKYDYKPYTVAGIYDGIHQAYPNNMRDMYRTGRYINTNVALSGGSDKGTFRFSYSNLQSDGISLNNTFDRNSFSLNATQEISSIVSTEAGFSYVSSDGRNPTYQGGDMSPVYDFSYSVPRDYDTQYWMQNYWSVARDGYNGNDPFGYSSTIFDYLENNQTQKEENYRGYVNVNFKLTNWLKFVVNADMNRIYKTFEVMNLATEPSEFRGASYRLNESKKLQYRAAAMLTATHRFNDLGLSGSLATERFDERQSYHNSTTNNGLRVPGIFELSNSVDPATTEARANVNRKRINSVYGFVNADWKSQVYLDITGRNDWSSTLRYVDGSGNVSYFYPSVSTSWLLTETFKESLPKAISFAKVRASYAIVGNDTDPYMVTNPGTYLYYNSFKDGYFGSGTYPYFKYANNNLGAANLKPEKQYAIEFGIDYRMFDNRIGIDVAYYKTNTKNQILALPTSTETGVGYRIINAGNIQNSGIELLLTATPIRTKDLVWDLSLTYTRNRNKIIELYPGVTKYQLPGGGADTQAWATEGGAYGDIYSSYAYKRDENGNKLLNSAGGWIRSGTSEKIGSIQPDFLGGLATNLKWKGFNLGAVFDARVGGDIFSASYNYGMAGGRLASSLEGRTQELGGLERKLSDGRTVYDGMIPDGVFDKGIKNKNGVDLSGMTYREAYDKQLVDPLSAYMYYANMYDWGNGIREASVHKLSWVALREVSLYWDIPKRWTEKAFIKGATLGFIVRNVGFLYNSLPDNIHPEGLKSNYSSEYYEAGGSVYSRNYGIKLNLTF
ncbi:SusC/RagA family TonB-linked outer membrane protein [Dysgonomonas sp. ZJ709]|uniref:SusC/RagA family TonB-linked outer membrane protein n=1 Tax=Dysgonomonas sp. ZJ709 TaxID=2709797 RepID=UPI00210537EA|nr:SusC/RagA family TonB-linked outer membrane protein [Dysgonomonas sp. ZJ709]